MPIKTHRRILWRQLLLFALLFLAVLSWLGYYLGGILRSANVETARRSNLLVVYAVGASMRAERSHEVWSRIIDQVPGRELDDIEIVDLEGRVAFSTDPARRGMTLRITDPLCAECHPGGSRQASAETSLITDPDDREYQVFAAPLRNEEDCQSCHTTDEQKLGMVLVRQSLAPIRNRIWTVQLALAGAGLIAFLLAVLTSRQLLGRYLRRPLKEVVAGAEAIGAGQLDHRIEIAEQTEFKVLADTLNDSAARLSGSIQSLKRQRNEAQTLYRLVDQLSRGVMPGKRRKRAVELAGDLLGSPCVLVRVVTGPETSSSDVMAVFKDGGETVDRPVHDTGEVEGAPAFYRPELVREWRSGQWEGEAEVARDGIVAYSLERSGRRLGLLLRPAQVPGEEQMEPDPEVVQALCRHVAIALEFSDLQRELLEEERLAAIGETVSGLAHWLKNTLNGLRAGQYVIDRGVELGDTAKLEKGWRVMKKSIQQVEKLTSDVLYCSRERTPAMAAVDLNALIGDLVESMEARAAEQGVRIVADLDKNVGAPLLDRDSIQRGLLNLVSNAIDACAASDTGDLVTVSSRRDSDEIRLRVDDNGAGMSESVQRRLFSRFFSTKGSKGTGLGLMVVKRIVEEHAGHLEVSSVPGSGSTFEIRLPRREETGPPEGA